MPSDLIKAYQESNILIEKAFSEKKVKPLKAMSNDIDEQVKHMPLVLAIELKNIFKEKLNIDFEIVEKLRLNLINKILKKGKILNQENYDLLLNRVEEIYADASKINEVNQINSLLASYHLRTQ